MDNTRLQEIQRENKIQEKQNEELRGRIEAVEAASKEILEDTERAGRIFTEERKDLLRQKQEIREASAQTSSQIKRVYHRASEIQTLQNNIQQAYQGAHTKTMALKERRNVGQKNTPYIVERNKLRSAVMAAFQNPRLHLVREDSIRKEAERFCVVFPDDWLSLALFSLTTENPIREKSLQKAIALRPDATCLYYVIHEAANGKKDSSNPTGLGDADTWLYRLGDILIKKLDHLGPGLTAEPEDIWMFESFLLLYAVLSRRMQRAEVHDLSEITQIAAKILEKSMEAEGLNRESAAKMLQLEFQKKAGTEDEHTPNWTLAPLFTEMDTYCTSYTELSMVLALASGSRDIYDEYVAREDISDLELNDILSNLLKKLAALPTLEEKEREKNVRFLELLADYGGDEMAARKAHQEELHRTMEFHIIRHFSEILCDYGGDGTKTFRGLRACLTELLLETEKTAARTYVQDYRSQYREKWPVRILSYNTELDFANSVDSAEQDAGAYYQRIIDANSGLMAGGNGGYFPSILCGVLSVIVPGILLYFGFGKYALAMAAFLFTVAIALALRHSYYRAAQNVEVNETCGKVKYILRLLYAEYEEIRDIYLYYDSYGDKLMNL